jgi:hypothetical protein
LSLHFRHFKKNSIAPAWRLQSFKSAGALISDSKSIAFRLLKHCFQTAKALLPASKVNEIAMQSQCSQHPKALLSSRVGTTTPFILYFFKIKKLSPPLPLPLH